MNRIFPVIFSAVFLVILLTTTAPLAHADTMYESPATKGGVSVVSSDKGGIPVQELPKTGLPLLAVALAGLFPAGTGLRRFGRSKQSNNISANTVWIERQLKY